MGYKYGNPTNRMRASEMLRRLLPEAKKLAEKSSYSMETTSVVGEASLKWYRTEHCRGVHIYQGDKGGWFADLEFTNLPDGIPAVIGTPSVAPNRTREEAVKSAISMLAMMMDTPTPTVSPQDAKVVFALDDMNVILPSALIAKMRAIREEPPSHDYIIERFEEVRKQFTGGEPFNEERMNSLSKENQMTVVTLCAMALLIGMPRYPGNPEVEPPPSNDRMH